MTTFIPAKVNLTDSNEHISAIINSPSATFAAIWVALVGVIAFMFLPLMVGGLADDLGFSNAQLGYIGAAEAGGMGLVSGLGIYWVRKYEWPKIILFGAIVMATINIISLGITDFGPMLFARFIDGCAGGSLIAIGVACQSDNKNADKVFGYFIALEMLFASIGYLVLPTVKDSLGVDGIFIALAIIAFTAIIATFFHPRRCLNRSKSGQQGQAGKTTFIIGVMALIGALLFFMSQGGLWTFVERIGVASHLKPEYIGLALAVSSFCGIAGALGANWFVNTVGRANAFLIVLVGEMICISMLYGGNIGEERYMIALCVFELFWSMGLPLLMGMLNMLDHSGRLILLLYAMGKLGYTLGPAIMGSLIIGDSDFSWVLILTAITCTLGLGLSITLILSAKNKDRQSAAAVDKC